MRIVACILSIIGLQAAAMALPAWEFDQAGNLEGWTPNQHLTETVVEEQKLRTRAVEWDPFLISPELDATVTPWHYLLIRIRATEPGEGELFWANSLEGPYGGFSQERTIRFVVPGGNTWQTLSIFPPWKEGRPLKRLRLDLYQGAAYEIDWIRMGVLSEQPLDPAVTEWTVGADEGIWQHMPHTDGLYIAPMAMPLGKKHIVSLTLTAKNAGEGFVFWRTANPAGNGRSFFNVEAGENTLQHINLLGYEGWRGNLTLMGLQFPDALGVSLHHVRLGETVQADPDLTAAYFGFENGVNRAERPCSVLAQIENRGGALSKAKRFRLKLPKGLTRSGSATQTLTPPMGFSDVRNLAWTVTAATPGDYPIALQAEMNGAFTTIADTTLTFLQTRAIEAVPYVPEPRPIETSAEIAMFYFPGWHTTTAWQCVEEIAPIRKPLLGYYNEALPEIVDWQIKWAVENGISIFLLDWYWTLGNEHLKHWFEAYNQSRYRDQLKVAIMWANHNPPGSHSPEDWEQVTQEWIDNYFSLPSYYHLDGKPAMFLWSPGNIRRDMKGSETVQAAFERSQQMAQDAGYAGITYVAMSDHQTAPQVNTLLEEGYAGATTYHEFGKALALSGNPMRGTYADLAATSMEKWAVHRDRCGPLTYYPVVDSGWDPRPWHGLDSTIISGRTVADFERILRDAKTFTAEQEKPLIILGPANEWGEGSYLEPNTEFGFGMYEVIRKVFATTPESAWPENLSPADLGLGPYAFPKYTETHDWQFDEGVQGWADMMGVSDFRCEGGALKCIAANSDPAMRVALRTLRAENVTTLRIRMRLTADSPRKGGAQFFWAVRGSKTSESASARFPVTIDGAWHEYTIHLAEHPNWYGRINLIRFDPVDQRGVTVEIDYFSLGK